MSAILNLLTNYSSLFLSGLRVTLMLSLFSIVTSTIIGSLICLLRMWGFAPFKWLCTAYIEIIRGTPILLQLYFFVFLLPRILPINLTNLQAVMLSMSLCAAAYVSELMRAGIQAVDKGQSEAARSLGLSSAKTMLRVVLPQAFKIAIPSLVNQFIITVKDTSILSVIGLAEVVNRAKQYVGSTFSFFATYVYVGALYLVVISLLMVLSRRIEKRMSYDRKG